MLNAVVYVYIKSAHITISILWIVFAERGVAMFRRIISAALSVLIFTCALASCSPAKSGEDTGTELSASYNAQSRSDESDIDTDISSEPDDSGDKADAFDSDSPPESQAPSAAEQVAEATTEPKEVRGMWIAFFELYPMFDVGKDFKEEFAAALDKCAEYGINTVYVHVRSHCDAFYKSSLFPWSKYVNGVDGIQGRDPGFDPLEIMISLAHERGIEFHAWINPYRVLKDSTDLSQLSDDNPAKKWLTDDDESNDNFVTECKGGLYLNPAEPQVQRLIADGVREIVQNYDVDGIHFDDYFYPTTDESFDEAQYAAYRASVNSNPLPLGDWRRANVNAMVSTVYNAVKSIKSDCIFGISPMASIKNNYNTVFADVKAWLDLGIVDYIMPQLYFGFEYPDDKSKFDNLLSEWDALFAEREQNLYIGLGSYRVGSTDSNHAEWSERDDVLSRQIALLRSDGISDGFVLYSYTTFFKNDELSEAVRNSFIAAVTQKTGD